MIRPLFAVALFTMVSLAASARPRVAVLMQFDTAYSARAVSEMQRETERVLKNSGFRFEWHMLKDVHGADSFGDLLVIRFKGRCQMEAAPVMVDGQGALGETYTSDGQVLPFTNVYCDRIRASMRASMNGAGFQNGNFVLGRAMGRVLAHEIYHVLGNTERHGHSGVARGALSGAQLLSDRLPMAPADLRRLTPQESGSGEDSSSSPEPNGR